MDIHSGSVTLCRCGCDRAIERHSYETEKQFSKRLTSGLFRARCKKNLRPLQGIPLSPKPPRPYSTLSLQSCNTGRAEMVAQEKEVPIVAEKYRAWVRGLPCLVPGCNNHSVFHHQNLKAHGGKGALCSDYRGLPLCNEHHTLGGTHGKPGSYHGLAKITGWTFWKVYGIDVEATIHNINALWLESGHTFKKGVL